MTARQSGELAQAVELSLSLVLAALSDPTRRTIVQRLSSKSGLCSSFADLGSKTALSYHFAKLRQAGMTSTEKLGTCRLIALRARELNVAFPGLLKAILRTNAPSR
ncbi:MAG: helix-turn-helix transcriptional regulator [Bryobacteraceae bacterium]|nr:helix-turn-helix transcriptional regulator [Bryobacteraceae bacterium]